MLGDFSGQTTGPCCPIQWFWKWTNAVICLPNEEVRHLAAVSLIESIDSKQFHQQP